MEFRVEIQHWEDEDGSSPVTAFYASLEEDHKAWIAKRDDYYEQYTVRELIMSPEHFESVKGVEYPLWELKYRGSGGRNYRMLCLIWDKKIVGLDLFHGSGSGGRLSRHIPTAIARAESWKKRNPLKK